MTVREWIESLFPEPGFYVEAGAHNGVGDSATYWMEQAGWQGICVEPSAAFAGLKESRTCAIDNRALWRADGEEILFREVSGNAIELSGILQCFGDHWDRETRPHRDRMVPTVTLTTLLREHNAPPVIEFLSLDTEGSEWEILSAHDFDAYRFRAVLVEHNGVDSKRAKLRELMAERGYRLCDDGQPAREIEDCYVWIP